MTSETRGQPSQGQDALGSNLFNQPRHFSKFSSIINVPTQEGVCIQMNERWNQLLTDGGNWYDYAHSQAQQIGPVLEYEERDFDAASTTSGGEDSGLDEAQSKASNESSAATSPQRSELSLADVCALLFRASPHEVPFSVCEELRCMVEAKAFNFSFWMHYTSPKDDGFY